MPEDDLEQEQQEQQEQEQQHLMQIAEERAKRRVKEREKKAKSKLKKKKKSIRNRLLLRLGGFILSLIPILVAIAGAVLLLLMIGAIIDALLPWGSGGSGDGDDSGYGATFGITGEDFYGARMVYADNEKSQQAIIENYVEFVQSGILFAEQTTTINHNETNYTVELNINIETPSEDFDYSTFDEASFSSEYADLYSMVKNIAMLTYNADNTEQISDGTLVQYLDGIKYFGFGDINQITTQTITTLINDDETSLVVKNSGGEVVSDETLVTQIEETLINEFKTQISREQKYSIRTEKLFVKDFIISGEEMIDGVKKENYVAMIFMPRKNVTFTNLSFSAGDIVLDDFTISVDGLNIETDGINMGNEEMQSYMFYSGEINLQATAFEDINTSDLDALKEGLSLIEIVESVDNYSTYLEEKTIEDSENKYLTIKKNGVVVNLKSSNPFYFLESETFWE